MKNEIKVLDHGFVKYKGHMGTDEEIVEVARVSHDGSKKRNNESLLRYLIRHGHHTPLEFAEIHFHIKAPIFVARQIFRHRTANFSEKSGRYTNTFNSFYSPPTTRMKKNKGKVGSSEQYIDNPKWCCNSLKDNMNKAFGNYYNYLDTDLTKEVARAILPLSTYTEFRFKMDLRNLLHFLKLRKDNHAQYETRQYADAISRFVEHFYPVTWKAFDDYEIQSIKLTKSEKYIIGYLLFLLDFDYGKLNDGVYFKELGMSNGEVTEFYEKLHKLNCFWGNHYGQKK